MAVTTIQNAPQHPSTRMPQIVDVTKMKLPTTKSQPSQKLSDYVLFIYGARKIGKTSLASQFPNALHLFCEPGGKGLSTYPMEIGTWEEFKHIPILLKGEDGAQFENVIVDTIDMAYNKCQAWYCRTNFIEHPSDPNDYGKTWDRLKTEFATAMDALANCGKGLIIISHAKEAEIKTRNHGQWTKVIPTLPDRAASYIISSSDLNAYYGYYGNERRLMIDGSEYVEAGTRIKYNFRTPNGERVISIPMGNSDEEAFANLMAAFNNEQEETGEEARSTAPTITDDRAMPLKPVGRK